MQAHSRLPSFCLQRILGLPWPSADGWITHHRMGTVRATGLVKTFGPVVAVNDLSFEAKAGELLTLLGPSGCGKTTTLRLVAGLARPDRRELHGRDPTLSSLESC